MSRAFTSDRGSTESPSTKLDVTDDRACELVDLEGLAERLLGADDVSLDAAVLPLSATELRQLAYRLKEHCLHGWSSNSARAVQAAAVLEVLNGQSVDPEVGGCTHWAQGIAALIGGRMEESLVQLDRAAIEFRGIGFPLVAAGTQVSKLIALAMLGRYDEAIECGLRAREVLADSNDLLSLGKIEHNLGNIYLRREHFTQAEEFLRHSLSRFTELGDLKQQTMVQVNLAYIRTIKNDFRAADRLYTEALEHATAAGLLVNQADIEANLGTLALFQGKYDRALDFLERARSKFAGLNMPHKTAASEQELADAYLELNLVPEAAAAYDRAAATFYELGLRAERAQVLSQRGQAAILLGDFAGAHSGLRESQTLFAAEGNHLGTARVQLTEAQLLFAEGEFDAAAATANAAQLHLSAAGIHRQAILAQWLRGESLRRRGDLSGAESALRLALESSDLYGPPMIKTACHTSLGLLFTARGNGTVAEGCFRNAIRLVEELRAPLPGEEFRTAFLANNLTPYHEMMRVCLDSDTDRVVEAFEFCERAKSRALTDTLSGQSASGTGPTNGDTVELDAELVALSEELNWFYRQLNRPLNRTADELSELQIEVRTRENRLQEVSRRRQLHSTNAAGLERGCEFDLPRLQRKLGPDVAVIEYTALDDELLAFVVTEGSIKAVRGLATVAQITAALDQFRFQIDSLRYGAAGMRRHLPRLTQKIQSPLRSLFDRLLAPVMPLIGDRRLVIVPHRELHYVPFHALFDGTSYVIESREVSYAPSAGVLALCLERDGSTPERALLLGASDENTPRVGDEINALVPFFAQSDVLLGDKANPTVLAEAAPGADVLHLACHGQFRPDNPMFSSLQLNDSWLTARDVGRLDLRGCGLVTLSACETGLNAVSPGDELIGLARGFFSAGAASLLLSQWVVDDAATAKFMIDFYRHLSGGARPAAALRSAQCAALAAEPHPFFWSPFILMGRW